MVASADALRKVGLHVLAEGPALFNLDLEYLRLPYPEDPAVSELVVRLPLRPELRLPGKYEVTPRLSFWNDNCPAIRYRAGPLAWPPTHLSSNE